MKGGGGAELAGQRQFVVEDVDGNDALGAGQARAEQRVEADAAEADHGDRTAGDDAGGVHHGTDTGQDGAAETLRLLQRKLAVDLHQRWPGADLLLREGRDDPVVGPTAAIRTEK